MTTPTDYDTLKAKLDVLETAYAKLLANYVNLQRQIVARDRKPRSLAFVEEATSTIGP